MTNATPGTSMFVARSAATRAGGRRHGESDEADRHVDEEDGTPSGASDVGRDQEATDELSAGGGQAHDDAVDGDGPHPALARIDHPEHREDVGAHEGRAHALREAGAHEDAFVRRQPAQGRRRDEGRQPEGEGAPPSDAVAQTPGGDQEHGEGQAVAGDDPFDRGRTGVQSGLDRGQGHVHDEEVQYKFSAHCATLDP